MDIGLKSFLTVFFVSSIALMGLTAAVATVRVIRSIIGKRKRRGLSIPILLMIFGAIWCIRFSVGCYSSSYPEKSTLELITADGYNTVCYISSDESALTKPEEVFNSIIHTFQSFSMDEDYTEYILSGKEMMKFIFGDESCLVKFFGIYASFLNVLAPICGGAILIDILQGAFPKFRLFISSLWPCKTKYYFSELNESALACAEGIIKQYKQVFRPVIVFTDAYTDGENEKSSELLKKAKSIGGICINDDLTLINHWYAPKKEYWLVDENEMGNIRTLSELSDEKHVKSLRKTIIRVFYHDDAYSMTESRTVARIRDNYEKKLLKKKNGDSLKFGKKTKIKYETVKCLTEKIAAEKAKRREDNCTENKKQKYACTLIRYKFDFDRLIEDLTEEYIGIIGSDKKISSEDIKQEAINRITDKKMPAVIRTQYYQSMIYNLLKDEPLYMPLTETKHPDKLNIAILGNGNIGTEMFLASYWCGQLNDIELSINMVSKDEPGLACEKINAISSDILESTKNNSELLNLYRGWEIKNPPYFKFRYCQSDFEFADISKIKCVNPIEPDGEEYLLTDADYFLVALGDDEMNIRAAERLMKEILIAQKGSGKKVTIAYVVYDSNLSSTLNDYRKSDSKYPNVTMKAVGSINETFSYENIVNKKYMLNRLGKDDNGEKDTGKNGKKKKDKNLSHNDWVSLSKMMAVSQKPYEFWSSYARDIHYEYKIFSAFAKYGCDVCVWKKWKECHSDYICHKDDDLASELAWLEHRRWNAYMRTIGFRKNDSKDVVFLKIHDCMVEHHKPHDSAPDNSEDFLETVMKNRDRNLIYYDYSGIIPAYEYKELFKK